MDLHIRKFPKVPIHNASRPLPHQKLPVLLNDKRQEPAGRGLRSLAKIWQAIDAILLKCHTYLFNRTNQAL